MTYALKRLFGEEFSNMLKINVLSAILCLFVITAGPVIIAVKALYIEILQSRCPLDRVKEFLRLVKKNFVRGLLFEALLAVFGLMLAWAVALNDRLGGRTILMVSIGLSGFLVGLASVAVATVLAAGEVKFTAAVRQGIFMMFGCFPNVLASAACVYGLVLLAYFLYPISFIPVVVLGISVASALSLVFMWPPCVKYILPEENSDEA